MHSIPILGAPMALSGYTETWDQAGGAEGQLFFLPCPLSLPASVLPHRSQAVPCAAHRSPSCPPQDVSPKASLAGCVPQPQGPRSAPQASSPGG